MMLSSERRLKQLNEIEDLQNTSEHWIKQNLVERLWGRHALARPVFGTAQVVQSFTSRVLYDYLSHTYLATNMIVLVLGNIDHVLVRALTTEAFMNARPGKTPPSDDDPPQANPGLAVYPANWESFGACLGVEAPGYRDPRKYLIVLLSDMLGGSPFSRLNRRVRDTLGWPQTIRSEYDVFRETGLLTVQMWGPGEHAEKAVEMTLTELDALKRHLVPPEELEAAKTRVISGLAVELEENNYRRASFRGVAEVYHSGQPGIEEAASTVGRITADDLRRIAKELLDKRAVAATIAGPEVESIRWHRLGLRSY